MTDAELLQKIESSAVLRRASENLFSEVSFRAGKSARFAIITILTAISIVVQIIALCQKRNSKEAIVSWLKNARTLPRIRTIRLRRRLDALWQEHCGDDPEECGKNVLFAALLDTAENATDDEINEIMQLAAEVRAAK
jgi:hypothetical protein